MSQTNTPITISPGMVSTQLGVLPIWAAIVIMLFGTSLVILIIFIISLFVYWGVQLYRKLYLMRDSASNDKNFPFIVRNAQISDLEFDIPEIKESWEVYRKNVILSEELGDGEFGKIYDGEVVKNENRVRAVIKTFTSGSVAGMAEFKMEMERLKIFRHKNVGRLIGVITTSVPFYTIMELPLNGSLKTFVVANRSILTNPTSQFYMSSVQMLTMSLDICNGCLYLETLPYIHTDLAARNCFVTGDLTIKITDYDIGRSLFTDEYTVMEDDSLMPVRWLSPESLKENVFTPNSIIWSLGITIWEIFSYGSFPFGELDDEAVYNRIISNFIPLTQPSGCPREVYYLLLKCWTVNQLERINLNQVQENLERIIVNIEDTLTTRLSDDGNDVMNAFYEI